MNDGRLDRALLFAILAAVGGLHSQLFSMSQRLYGEVADVGERLSGEIADVSERMGRIETHLENIAPRSAGPAPDQTPSD